MRTEAVHLDINQGQLDLVSKELPFNFIYTMLNCSVAAFKKNDNKLR